MKHLFFNIVVILLIILNCSCKQKNKIISAKNSISKGFYVPSKIEWDTISLNEDFSVYHKVFTTFLLNDSKTLFLINAENENENDSILIAVQIREILKCTISANNRSINSEGNIIIDNSYNFVGLDTSVFYRRSYRYKIVGIDSVSIDDVLYVRTTKINLNDNSEKIFKKLPH